MARAAKLKVYTMPAGFHDAVVAAPSQAAALRAWGTTTDLFAAGRAFVVEDEAVKAEALAKPGEVIKRMRGDEAAMLGPEPAAPFSPKSRAAGKAKRKVSSPRPAPASPPDRSKLDDAERALAQAEREMSAELDALAIERANLERREGEARRASDARLKVLRRAKDEAEAAYEKAERAAAARRR